MKPRGRPPKDCTWNGVAYVRNDGGGAHTPPVRRPVIARPVLARPVVARPSIDELRRAAEAQAAKAEEERRIQEAKAAEEAEKLRAKLKEQRDREQREAPRRYAQTLYTGKHPVYYFDIYGRFEELGKERPTRTAAHHMPTISKKRKKGVVRRVVGPSEEHGLCTGESEYISD
jgi:hypothetical protein